MILFVNGDSNSDGTELSDRSKSWPNLLAKKLNCPLENLAQSGCSNDRIYRTTLANIDQICRKQGFLIIGWTSWEREEWLVNNHYYQVNAGGHDQFPTHDLQQRYKEWVSTLHDDTQKIRSHFWHDKIFDLHQQLKTRKIAHLFFNALMPFHKISTHRDWGNNYINPYSNNWAYFWHLKQQGFRPTADNHHLESAQEYWADIIFDRIKTNDF